jgi:probable F420-dependent oxidoreductase
VKFVLGLFHTPADQYVQLGCLAEDLGFEGAQIGDHLVMPVQLDSVYPYRKDTWEAERVGQFEVQDHWPDPWVTAAAMAARTRSLRLYTAVYVLPLRNPFVVAKAVGTAAVLSGGRMVLGAGIGWMREEFELGGQSFARRGARMDEDIAVLRALWSGRAEFHGRFYDFGPVDMLPRPAQPVPILIGGESAAALRRAATLGDGYISLAHRAATLAEILMTLRDLRAEHGRADEPFETVVICTDARSADVVRPRAHEHGGHAERLERFADRILDAMP